MAESSLPRWPHMAASWRWDFRATLVTGRSPVDGCLTVFDCILDVSIGIKRENAAKLCNCKFLDY